MGKVGGERGGCLIFRHAIPLILILDELESFELNVRVIGGGMGFKMKELKSTTLQYHLATSLPRAEVRNLEVSRILPSTRCLGSRIAIEAENYGTSATCSGKKISCRFMPG